jgi:hypothetical protein
LALTMYNISQKDFQALESCLSGLGKVSRSLKPDHMFLLASGDRLLEAEAEVLSQLRLDTCSDVSPVPARWATGNCQTGTTEIISSSVTGSQRERTARDTPFYTEVISPPLSQTATLKTYLDSDLGDFCDWIRKNRGM